MITEWKVCRICGGSLESILNLGDLYLSTFLAEGDPLPPKAPLDLVICDACDLVQLRHSVDPDQLFRKYWYLSGVNESMKAELADIAEQAVVMVGPFQPTDTVVDIGANDGTLLRAVGKIPLRVAFEPARNLYDILRPHTDALIADYFPHGLGEAKPLSAKAIFSIAMFYDLDDPKAFVQAIADHLHPQGVWVVQFQDLCQMLQATAFDNICHEHVTCPTLGMLIQLVAGSGLEVVKAERRAINGGSLRCYVRHMGVSPAVEGSVTTLLALESHLYDDLQQFAWRVPEVKRQVVATLEVAAKSGPVDCYGGSTKFNTLAQYCGIGPSLIRQCVERSPAKYGLKTVTGIPIVSEEVWRESAAPTTLLAIWQHRDFVLNREANYLATGGSFIVPLPHPEVVYAELKPLEEAI